MDYWQWVFWTALAGLFAWTQWQQGQRDASRHQQQQQRRAGGPEGGPSMAGKLEQMQQMMLQRQAAAGGGGGGSSGGAAGGSAAGAGAGRADAAAPAPAPATATGGGNDPAHDAALRDVVTDYLRKADAHRADMGDRRVTVEHVMLALAEDRWFSEVISVAEALDDDGLKRAVRKSRVIHGRGGVAGADPSEGGGLGGSAAAGGGAGGANGGVGGTPGEAGGADGEAGGDAAGGDSGLPPLGGGAFAPGQGAAPKKDALSLYGRDLTQLAREGRLDPIIGRAEELRRVADVLCRRTKNSCVLVGEPGVGKTACVEGLAQRVAAGDVPEALRGCRLIALDLALLSAGASFPGEFEERMVALIQQLQSPPLAGKALLFIDDLHSIGGPNAQQGGGVNDASAMLKPLLGRGEVRLVGCTTADKYRRFIERDPALERRFQQVALSPPTVQETVSILRGLRTKYERHHGVRIADAALAAAAALTERYLPDRCLPDKAIDAVDEACAKVRTDLDLKPEALDALERRAAQLSDERRLLARAADAALADAAAEAELEALDAELADLRARAAEMAAELEEQIRAAAPAQELRDALDALDSEIEDAEAGGDSEQADGLRAKRRGEILRQLRSQARTGGGGGAGGGLGGGFGFGRKKGGGGAKGGAAAAAAAAAAAVGKLTRAEVAEADVARVVSKWTGIPLTKLVEAEAGKLMTLADDLRRRVAGQGEAVAAVAEAVQRARAGMKDPDGPIASFLFLGPTGVGKTELAKALACALFSSEEAMVRLDMSEYMEKHSVAKLIGAPPGYVGYDDPGQLTEAVRRRPYCVVLFDEVEKAHVDIFALLLQILDDGRVTDSQGRLVSFKNAIIILTSNLGSAEIFQHTYGRQQQRLLKKGQPSFPPGANANANANADADNADADNDENNDGDGDDEEEAAARGHLRGLVMARVRKHFAPEFVNRLDECIIFEPLAPEQIRYVVRLKLRGVGERLAEKRLALAVRDGALSCLAAAGYDPVYGARPVKRAVQRQLETPLSKALLTGRYAEGDTVVVDAADGDGTRGGGLAFFRVPAPPAPSDEEEESGDPEGAEGGGGRGPAAPPGGGGDPEAGRKARRERVVARAAARAAAAAAAAANPEPVDIPGYGPGSVGGRRAGAGAGGKRGGIGGGAGGSAAVDSGGSVGGSKAVAAAAAPGAAPAPPPAKKFDPLAARKGPAKRAAATVPVPVVVESPAAETNGDSGANGTDGAVLPPDGGAGAASPSPSPSAGGGASATDAASAMLHLDPDDVPTFLKPVKRRDGQDDSLPSCAE